MHVNGWKIDDADPASFRRAIPDETCPLIDEALEAIAASVKECNRRLHPDDFQSAVEHLNDAARELSDVPKILEKVRVANGQLRELLGLALESWAKDQERLESVREAVK